jgi:hypothetical protein
MQAKPFSSETNQNIEKARSRTISWKPNIQNARLGKLMLWNHQAFFIKHQNEKNLFFHPKNNCQEGLQVDQGINQRNSIKIGFKDFNFVKIKIVPIKT